MTQHELLDEAGSNQAPNNQGVEPELASSAHQDSTSIPPSRVSLDGDVHAEQVMLAQTLNYVNFASGGAPKLSFEVLPSTDDRTQALFEKRDVHETVAVLGMQRLLVIVGPPESGKATFADEVLRHLVEGGDKLRLCRQLQEDTPFDPDRIAQNAQYRGCGLIVKDAFQMANRQLEAFTRQLTTERLANTQKILEDAGAFLVLTSDDDKLPAEWSAGHRAFLWRAPRASRETLERVLNKAVEDFAHNESLWGADDVLSLDSASVESILARADTVPKVVRFARDYFPALKGGATLEQVLGSFSHPATWFLRTLPQEAPVAWCMAMGVLLGHAQRGTASTQWWVAATVAEALSRSFFEGRAAGSSDAAPLLAVDEALFRRARVAVDWNRSHEGGLEAFFTHPNAAEELWALLFESGKGVLHALLPVIERMGESDDSALQSMAYTALGRIEVQRGHSNVVARLRQFVDRGDEAGLRALARYVVGIYSSGDRARLARCLRELKHTLRSATTRRDRDPLMFGLRALGAVDPVLVADELLHVVAEEVAIDGGTANDKDTLFFVAHVAIGTCLVQSPLEFCLALSAHTLFNSSGPDGTRIRGAVAQVLFGTQKPADGVFGVLQRNPTRELGPAANILKRDRIVETLDDSSPARIQEFGEFLLRCFDAAGDLPLNTRRRVEQQIVGTLEQCSQSAVGSKESEESLEVLLGFLCRQKAQPLGQQVRALLKSPAFGTPELAELATRALLG